MTANSGSIALVNEARAHLAKYISATPEELDAMALYAIATHGASCFKAFGRLLFTSKEGNCGKTEAMKRTAALSANPINTKGTSFALDALMAEVSGRPEIPVPTLYRDEISSMFGASGTSGQNNPLADAIREGYLAGATSSRSVNRVMERYSIYSPFILAGLRRAVPNDVRTRCIPVVMKAAVPPFDFDDDDYAPAAERNLQEALSALVRSHRSELKAFPCRGLHDALTGRLRQIWRPLMAVALELGGDAWLRRAITAFRVLTLGESVTPPLSNHQLILQAMAAIAEAHTDAFIGGLAIAEELADQDTDLFDGRTVLGIAKLVANAMPVESDQRRVNGVVVRGYTVTSIISAWDAVKPQTLADELPDQAAEVEENPFDVTDVTDDVTDVVVENVPSTSPVTGVTGVTVQSARQSALNDLTAGASGVE